jgi:hypothetical protein
VILELQNRLLDGRRIQSLESGWFADREINRLQTAIIRFGPFERIRMSLSAKAHGS